MNLIKQSSTAQPLVFLMVDNADHLTGKTGLSPTVTLSKAGGAFASPAGAVTEIANGWYKVAGNATDNATLGPLILHATGSGADPTDVVYEVVAFDPQDAVHFGLTALPNVASGSAGAIPTTGTGANQIQVNGAGKISGVVLADTVTTYTGNTVQSGDAFARLGAPAGASASADIAAVKGDTAASKTKTDSLTFTISNQVDANVITKTGFKLASDGLDSIATTAPSGVASTFPAMLVQLWRRFFRKSTLTATQLKTYADDGTTIVTTQTVSDDNTTETQGNAS